MKLPVLIVSDPHFTANPDDEYRWALWPWLRKQLQAEKAKTLLILGDLTDAKDYHSATLVNRLVGEITETRAVCERIIVLMGNHDYLKGGNMFFRFLGLQRGIDVITKPTEDLIQGEVAAMFLPHTRNPMKDWSGYTDMSHYDYVFMHQTIRGAVAGNGQALEGENMPDLSAAGKVYSGDIHVPQVVHNPIVGDIEYVGSPYPVHHGDSFEPRCVLLDRDRKAHDLCFETIRRSSMEVHSIDELRSRLKSSMPGDQVKVRIVLPEAEKHHWNAIRRTATELLVDRKLTVTGIKMEIDRDDRQRGFAAQRIADPRDALLEFVNANALGGELLDAGLDCLEDRE